MSVTGTPSAEVYLDGTLASRTTPYLLYLIKGKSYTVTLQQKGYKTEQIPIVAEAGKRLEYGLEPESIVTPPPVITDSQVRDLVNSYVAGISNCNESQLLEYFADQVLFAVQGGEGKIVSKHWIAEAFVNADACRDSPAHRSTLTLEGPARVEEGLKFGTKKALFVVSRSQGNKRYRSGVTLVLAIIDGKLKIIEHKAQVQN
jgi:hypothetical protein